MSGPDTDLDSAVVELALQDGLLHKALLDQLDEGIYIVDRNRRILYWNAGAEQITGYRAQEVAGHLCHGDLMMHCDCSGAVLCGTLCPLSGVMLDGKSRVCTAFLRHKHGHRVPVDIRSRAIYDPRGKIIGAVEVFEEVPPRPRMHSLQTHGCVEELTGLANRRYGEMKAAHGLEILNAFGIPFGWLRVELDALDQLEHRYGHGMIDAAVGMVARTLDGNIGPLDLLAHWDRAGFRVAVQDASLAGLADLAEKLVVLVRASNLDWWGDRLHVTVSIGGALAEPGDSCESLEARTAEVFASCQASGGDRAAVAHFHAGELGLGLIKVTQPCSP